MIIKPGATDVSTPIVLLDNTATDGSTKPSMTSTHIGMAYFRNQGAGASYVDTITETSGSLTAHADGGIVEIGTTTGVYKLDWPDAAFLSGADWVLLHVFDKGSNGFADVHIRVELENVTDMLAGATVSAVSGAVGSVTGAVGSVTGNVGGSVASVTGAVGSVTGNVGGSVASVTGAVGSVTGNVGGSVASVTGAVGSVTGNVGGSVASVTGAVGSVTGSVASVTGAVGSVTAGVTLDATAAESIADAVWDEATAAHVGGTTFGGAVSKLSTADVRAQVDAAFVPGQASIESILNGVWDEATAAHVGGTTFGGAVSKLSTADVRAQVDAAFVPGQASYNAIGDACWKEVIADHSETPGSAAEALKDNHDQLTGTHSESLAYGTTDGQYTFAEMLVSGHVHNAHKVTVDDSGAQVIRNAADAADLKTRTVSKAATLITVPEWA